MLHLEKQINKQAQQETQTYALKRENQLLTSEKEELRKLLTEKEQRRIGLEVPEPDYFEQFDNQRGYEGPTMGL